MYKIDSIDIAYWGLSAVKTASSSLAISGVWNLPKRKGETSYDWAEKNDVQAFVSKQDIVFEGRKISLSMVMVGDENTSIYTKLKTFRDFIFSLKDKVFTLSSDWGEWEVQFNGVIEVDYVTGNIAEIVVRFTEVEPLVSKTLPVPQGNEQDIDGYSFSELGLYGVSTSNIYTIPSFKTIGTTSSDRSNTLVYGGSQSQEITLQGLLKASSYNDFLIKVNNLQAVFSAPGIHKLYHKGNTHNFYADKGFTIDRVQISETSVTASWGITIRTAYE